MLCGFGDPHHKASQQPAGRLTRSVEHARFHRPRREHGDLHVAAGRQRGRVRCRCPIPLDVAQATSMDYRERMMTEQPKRPRGRPRNPAKRAALLSAARKLFLQLGADVVTVDQVIAHAAVSRATFYSNFADKHELLAAVIASESQRIVTDDWATEHVSADLRGALTDFGERLIRFAGEADVMAFERLIAHVTQSQPCVGPNFFAAGPGRSRGILQRIIALGQERGELREADPEQAANDLMGLWQGFWRIEVGYGLRPGPDEEEQRRLAHHGVEQFLRLYGLDI